MAIVVFCILWLLLQNPFSVEMTKQEIDEGWPTQINKMLNTTEGVDCKCGFLKIYSPEENHECNNDINLTRDTVKLTTRDCSFIHDTNTSVVNELTCDNTPGDFSSGVVNCGRKSDSIKSFIYKDNFTDDSVLKNSSGDVKERPSSLSEICDFEMESIPSTSGTQKKGSKKMTITSSASDEDSIKNDESGKVELQEEAIKIFDIDLHLKSYKWAYVAKWLKHIFIESSIFEIMDVVTFKKRLCTLLQKIESLEISKSEALLRQRSNCVMFYYGWIQKYIHLYVSLSEKEPIYKFLDSIAVFNICYVIMTIFTEDSFHKKSLKLIQRIKKRRKYVKDIKSTNLGNIIEVTYFMHRSRVLMRPFNVNFNMLFILLKYVLFVVNDKDNEYKDFEDSIKKYNKPFVIMCSIQTKLQKGVQKWNTHPAFQNQINEQMEHIELFQNELNNIFQTIEKEQIAIKETIKKNLGTEKNVATFFLYELGKLFFERIYIQKKQSNNLLLCLQVFHDFLKTCENAINEEDCSNTHIKLLMKSHDKLIYLIFLHMQLQTIRFISLAIKSHIGNISHEVRNIQEKNYVLKEKRVIDRYLKSILELIKKGLYIIEVIVTKKKILKVSTAIMECCIQIDQKNSQLKQVYSNIVKNYSEPQLKRFKELYDEIMQLYNSLFNLNINISVEEGIDETGNV